LAGRGTFSTGGVEWFAPFAPLRGLNEVQAIVNEKSNLLELGDKEWLELAEGVSKVLKFYYSQGYSTFNIVIASGPVNEHLEYFDVNLRIISRPGIQQWGFTDAWAAPYLLWDGEAVEEPEIFAKKNKDFLQRNMNSKRQFDKA
jgi:diadenosine tetraphosphate (Ap4A) HIT family hydrolase